MRFTAIRNPEEVDCEVFEGHVPFDGVRADPERNGRFVADTPQGTIEVMPGDVIVRSRTSGALEVVQGTVFDTAYSRQ